MIDGIIFIEKFIGTPSNLFDELDQNVKWDERMAARKTASFGIAYNYSQMDYPYKQFSENLQSVVEKIESVLNFRPNNCLINYYLDGDSKMGFHSDQTDILEKGTGVAIVSLGETRVLRFRNIKNREHTIDYLLPAGSLLYMTQEIQNEWQHAIPKHKTNNARMSLTFRNIKIN
jgi:alkylated DNA repair dioxygenase AlkB